MDRQMKYERLGSTYFLWERYAVQLCQTQAGRMVASDFFITSRNEILEIWDFTINILFCPSVYIQIVLNSLCWLGYSNGGAGYWNILRTL